MKTRNCFVVLISFLMVAIPGIGATQNISDFILKKSPEKSSANSALHNLQSNSSRICFPSLNQQKKEPLGDPHPDTIVVYSTSSKSMKEVYSYNANYDVLNYTRQYFKPQGWINEFKVLNLYDGLGFLINSLLQDWQSSGWVDSMKIVNTYDGSGNMLTSIMQDWETGSWLNLFQEIYTYDLSGNILTQTNQDWDGTDWINTEKYVYTYDGNGNQLTGLSQYWTGSDWENMNLVTNTYNGAGSLLTAMMQDWDGSAWLNNQLETWVYDPDENMVNYIFQVSWDGTTWENMSQEIRTYDSNGNNLTILTQTWEGGSWMDYEVITNTFDLQGNRLSYVLQYFWGEWVNFSNGTWTYDGDNNVLSGIWQNWFGSEWVNFGKTLYSYENNMIHAEGFGWNGGAWITDDFYLTIELNNNGNPVTFYTGQAYLAMTYYSFWPTSVKNSGDSFSPAFSVSPNPASDILNIAVKLKNEAQITFSIYDLRGKIVARINKGILLPGENTFSLSTINLPSGEYILQMDSGQRKESLHVLIQK